MDVAHLLGEKNPFAHLNETCLHPSFTRKKNAYQSWKRKYDKLISDSREDFVRHYHQTHGTDLPIWVACRDASIQRFEYSYELATKMLKRYLSLTLANPSELTEMTFQNLIRTAYGKGFIPNSWDQWALFRHARNITSHTYSEEKAIEVLEVLPLFYEEAAFLLSALERANETQL